MKRMHLCTHRFVAACLLAVVVAWTHGDTARAGLMVWALERWAVQQLAQDSSI